ncbi:hypothetical protein [Nocardioides sp. W7]|uniref:hypothetical protein n=1 Tax=Nocardioides sp. W7 TaxID=2931390 RepID=UPI001FD2721F|nr:hypothetical protein [Nocardioides sp. W7]
MTNPLPEVGPRHARHPPRRARRPPSYAAVRRLRRPEVGHSGVTRLPLREHHRSETFVNTRTIAVAALVIAVILLLFLLL